MDNRIFVAGFLGAVVIFVWTAISHLVLPFHDMTVADIPNEDAVMEVLKDNIEETGVYFYPGRANADSTLAQKLAAGPRVPFMVYREEGAPEMTPSQFVFSFLFNFIAATIVAWMLSMTSDNKLQRYGQRVLFVTFFGVFIAVFSDLMMWNWMHFPMSYVIITAYDNIITWVLAGTVIAWRIDPKNF
ncbi:MAG: hypothetical protein GY863_19865 [bacterium]|nr:hypothetical protein [bacterium]